METTSHFDPVDNLSYKHCLKLIEDFMAEHDKDRLNYDESLKYIKENFEPLKKVG